MIPPLRSDGETINVSHTPGKYLRAALDQLGLSRPGLGWYEATRYTFASQWVLNGGSIEKLKEILGHYSAVMTERYAHLRADLFAPKDLGTIALDLKAGAAVPLQLGKRLASATGNRARRRAQIQTKNRSGPVSRVLSPTFRAGGEHSSRALVAQDLVSEQPGSMGRATLPFRALPYWLLLQVGFAVPLESPRARCALTAPFHPYRPHRPAVCFLWHFPAGRPDWPLASTVTLWSSDFPLAASNLQRRPAFTWTAPALPPYPRRGERVIPDTVPRYVWIHRVIPLARS